MGSRERFAKDGLVDSRQSLGHSLGVTASLNFGDGAHDSQTVHETAAFWDREVLEKLRLWVVPVKHQGGDVCVLDSLKQLEGDCLLRLELVAKDGERFIVPLRRHKMFAETPQKYVFAEAMYTLE